MNDNRRSWRATTKAVLTDIHFWVPVAVLAAGLVLLVLFGAGQR
jgi:hypothetical protein